MNEKLKINENLCPRNTNPATQHHIQKTRILDKTTVKTSKLA
jgi:hypothetical protein